MSSNENTQEQRDKGNRKYQPLLSRYRTDLSSPAPSSATFLGGLGTTVGNTFSGAGSTVGNTMSGLGSTAGSAAQGVGQTVSGASEGLGQAAKGLGNSVNKAVGTEKKPGE